MQEFVTFDEAILGIQSFNRATHNAMEKTLIRLAPRLKRKIVSKIGRAIGSEKSSFNWEPLSPLTILNKERLGLGKNGDPFSMLYGTGEFAESIKVHVSTSDLSIQIVSDTIQAVYIEFGSSTQPARPVFRPAAKMAVDEFKVLFEDAMQEEYSGIFPHGRSYRRRTTYTYWDPWFGEMQHTTGGEISRRGRE